MDCDNPVQLLTSLPYDYTVDMAVNNHDVLRTPEGKGFKVQRKQVRTCVRWAH